MIAAQIAEPDCSNCGLPRYFHLIDEHEAIILKVAERNLEEASIDIDYVPPFNIAALLTDDEFYNDILLSFLYNPGYRNWDQELLLAEVEKSITLKRLKSSNRPVFSDAIQRLLQEDVEIKHDPSSDDLVCTICGDFFPLINFHKGSCGHIFCLHCLQSYYTSKISSQSSKYCVLSLIVNEGLHMMKFWKSLRMIPL